MASYEKFDRALQRLALQYGNYAAAASRAELRPLDREAIAESVIQPFETCYDCAWKALKRHLAEHYGLPPSFRTARSRCCA